MRYPRKVRVWHEHNYVNIPRILTLTGKATINPLFVNHWHYLV